MNTDDTACTCGSITAGMVKSMWTPAPPRNFPRITNNTRWNMIISVCYDVALGYTLDLTHCAPEWNQSQAITADAGIWIRNDTGYFYLLAGRYDEAIGQFKHQAVFAELSDAIVALRMFAGLTG